MQYYNAAIEYVPGILNIPSVFSKLMEKDILNHVMVLKFSAMQWSDTDIPQIV